MGKSIGRFWGVTADEVDGRACGGGDEEMLMRRGVCGERLRADQGKRVVCDI